MAQFELHRRQFVLSGERSPLFATWRTTSLDEGLFLHACPSLPHQVLRDASGATWHLLGLAVNARRDETPAQTVARLPTAEVLKATDEWAGRWVLIGQGELHLDAAGMLGVLYDPLRKVASSSPALASGQEAPELPRLEQTDPVNWYASPRSGFRHVRRLMPSQVLRLGDFTPRPRPLTTRVEATSYEEVLDALQDALVRTVRAGASQFSRTFIALTGGYDSRLLLSTAVYAGVSVETYTLVHPSSISAADVVNPRKLARSVGRPYQLFPRPLRRKHPEVPGLYARQSAGHAVEQDQHWLSYGQFDHLHDGDLVLTGGAFELGRTFFWRGLAPGEPSIEKIEEGLGPLPEFQRAGFLEWLAWVRKTPQAMDWRDRFYWEQRPGGWLTAGEQAMDLANGTRLASANSRYVLSLLLMVPAEKRLESRHHVDLIARMAPQLLNIPFNPPDPLVLRAAHKVHRFVVVRVRRLRRQALTP